MIDALSGILPLPVSFYKQIIKTY